MTTEKARPHRRDFMKATAIAGGIAALGVGPAAEKWYPWPRARQERARPHPDSVHTNISQAQSVPKAALSMPGPFPGVVAEVEHPGATSGRAVDAAVVAAMLDAGMSGLTGAADPRDAWRAFFEPGDRVGIKVNPIGGRLHFTAHELVAGIISKLESVAVPRSNIVIWDRYEHQLTGVGFTPERYNGIECIGLTYVDRSSGREVWRGEDRIDEDAFFECDHERRLSDDNLRYMIHGGQRSHFTSILTQRVDKVINVPIFKTSGFEPSLCLKGLAFGSTSNCSRGHDIFTRYISEVCAMPPVRDKTVLNIIDGLFCCYSGSGAPVAQFMFNSNRLFFATDPVAADTVGWQRLFEKQVAEGVNETRTLEESFARHDYLVRSENLGLGVHLLERIDNRRIALG